MSAFYSNPDFDELIFAGDGVTATSLDAAIENFQQANQMLVDDGAAIFVMDLPALLVVRSDLEGYYYSPAYGSLVRVYNMER